MADLLWSLPVFPSSLLPKSSLTCFPGPEVVWQLRAAGASWILQVGVMGSSVPCCARLPKSQWQPPTLGGSICCLSIENPHPPASG